MGGRNVGPEFLKWGSSPPSFVFFDEKVSGQEEHFSTG